MIKNENGQSLVETALILPILLILLVGIVDFGRVLYMFSHLHMATQETVRLGGLGKNDAEITEFARNYIHIGDPANLSVGITPIESNRKPGDYVTVTLQYPINIITPGISSILPSPFNITVDSTIRVE